MGVLLTAATRAPCKSMLRPDSKVMGCKMAASDLDEEEEGDVIQQQQQQRVREEGGETGALAEGNEQVWVWDTSRIGRITLHGNMMVPIDPIMDGLVLAATSPH